jgi:DNA-3-methyladenine glycosylase
VTLGAAPRARRQHLAPTFYDRETEQIARDLLGAVLRSETPDGVTAGRIVETEAYLGEHDPACHAVAGNTARTRWLYGEPGIAYVYFIYGVHWCFNAVTRAEGLASAVLVRAVEPVKGIELMQQRRGPKIRGVNLTNGPGKLCSALGIDGSMNGLSLQRGPLVVREGARYSADEIVTGPRIGITKAVDWPLRYYIRDNEWVSGLPRRRVSIS